MKLILALLFTFYCGYRAAVIIQPVTSLPAVADPPLRICAFNVRVFGVTKMKKSDVVSTLINIFLDYDLILVQEIRDSSGEAFELLEEKLNSEVLKKKDPRGTFKSVISERLGRTDSKEQYGFLYRETLLKPTDTFQVPEELDLFERPPFIVRFASHSTEIKDFAVLALHSKPTKAAEELDNVTMIYNAISNEWNLQDILVAGDLNSDCTYLPDGDHDKVSLYMDKRFKWLIGDDVDTTTSHSECSYDRFIAAGEKLQKAVVPNSAKVVHFDKQYGLTQSQTEAVSDHYPIAVMLAGKANLEVQSKVEDSKTMEVTSKVRVSHPDRIRELYRKQKSLQFIADFKVTVLKEGTKQALIIAEKVMTDIGDTIKGIENFRNNFPELVTEAMEAYIIQMINSDAFQYDYVYGFDNSRPQFRLKLSCIMHVLLCTLRVEKHFG